MATLPALPNVKDFSLLEPRQEIIGYSPEGDPSYKQIPMDLGLAQYGVYNNVPKEALDKLKTGKATRDFSDPDNPSWVGPSVKVNGITYQGDYNPYTGELVGITSNARFDADGGMVLGRYSVDGTARPYFSSSGSFLQNISPLLTAAAPFIAPGLGSVISNQLGISSTLGNVLANTAIQTTAAGGDLQEGLTNAIKSSVVSSIINNPETVDLNTQTADLQDVYGGNLSTEDISAAFDTVSPLADTTVALDTTAPVVPNVLDTAFVQDMSQGIEQPSPLAATDTAFLQDMDQGIDTTPVPEPVDTSFVPDMDQGIQPEVNLEGGDLGMTEAEAQKQFYEDIGLNPDTVVDTEALPGPVDIPDVTETPSIPNLTPNQLINILKLGAGLLGGGGLLSNVVKNFNGADNGGGDRTMPIEQAPTPFTGTYSGMNPYDAAYFQQVQQNYNRLFPTAPTDVATPLQSWYQTKFVPDTEVSKKLFGV